MLASIIYTEKVKLDNLKTSGQLTVGVKQASGTHLDSDSLVKGEVVVNYTIRRRSP